MKDAEVLASMKLFQIPLRKLETIAEKIHQKDKKRL